MELVLGFAPLPPLRGAPVFGRLSSNGGRRGPPQMVFFDPWSALICRWKMVMFHSYVSLPEDHHGKIGSSWDNHRDKWDNHRDNHNWWFVFLLLFQLSPIFSRWPKKVLSGSIIIHSISARFAESLQGNHSLIFWGNFKMFLNQVNPLMDLKLSTRFQHLFLCHAGGQGFA